VRPRPWLTWLVFTLCALAVLEGLGWVTWQAVHSEKREIEAKAQAAFQETIRLALWRMESEVTPIIAQESARPYFQYRSFYAAEQAYTRMWQEVETGEVLVPSPLLESSGQFIKMHFQIGPDGQITSPQAPTGNMRDLAESQYVDGEFIVLAGQMLDELSIMVRSSRLAMNEPISPEEAEPRRDDEVTKPQQAADLPDRSLVQPAAKPQVELQKSVDASEKEFQARKQAAESVYQNENSKRSQTRAQVPENKTIPEDKSGTTGAPLAAAPSARVGGGGAPGAPAPPGKEESFKRAAPEPSRAPADRAELDKLSASTEETRAAEQGAGRALATGAFGDSKTDEKDRGRALGPKVKMYQSAGPRPAQEVETGPLKPVWMRNPRTGAEELLVERTITLHGAQTVQGFWIDWPGLRARLLVVVKDLMPAADLRPAATEGAGTLQALRLASLPVILAPGVSPTLSSAAFSTTHVTLAVTWLAVLAGIIAIGIVLRAAMELGERRGRFVSAVTHELRTPLTTFCLYTEMLADGMVQDEGKKREYYATLKGESRRLAGIVENVLDYARLGGARRVHGHVRTNAAEMLARIIPTLERCTDRAGMKLELDVAGAEGLDVAADAPTVERVLLNLVENACKYAVEAEDHRVHLVAGLIQTRRGSMLELRVRDHGPGISRAERRKVFIAFRRGKRDADSAKSGLGLGLALARGLARGLGGDLSLCGERSDGAEFCLTLPAFATR
jgi:signal transduction histidine kinase